MRGSLLRAQRVDHTVTFDVDEWQRDIIFRNVDKDPSYAPYSMRCPGLVRMRKVDHLFWRCPCGAKCDYRRV